MTAREIIEALWLPPLIFKDLGIIVVILTIIEITPIKLNPWKWIKNFVKLPERLNTLETEYYNDKAYRWRAMILNRSDRVRRGEKLSEERWSDTIETIDRYLEYCAEQEKKKDTTFINGKATAAIEYLQETYKRVLETRDFLR